ncbi:MAG: CDP-alcohol phosphatidyltransferase family protein [Proteobacteria bacterium]|nr:CDP-alcohol phosphatidyltransferase family protein [Pseudomonadota bacterium]MBU1545941.1 CDP-alcohol phosphatidyltransferase family protein [Pseudomonadota bacterium]MBU2618502.1 CDP-alcohol phosphatidyltransferase family protein [Pseudomonadota bacterium]
MLKKALTIPNLLSILRILLAPLLLVAAARGLPGLFLFLFILSLVSDALDGFLARRLNQVSEWGAQLDSWGDLATYFAAPLGVWLLWPALVRQELTFILLGLGSFLLPVLLGFYKFRRLTSYHTRAARFAAVLLGIAVPLLLVGGPSWPFRFAILLFLLAELEEVAITLRLKHWQANIPSFWHCCRRPPE